MERNEASHSWTEADIESCRLTENEWKCPFSKCGVVLSRKQSLKNHMRCIHNEIAGNPIVKYKKYVHDSSVPIPRSTVFNRKRKAMDQQDIARDIEQVFNLDTDYSTVPMEITESDDSDNADTDTDAESNSDSDSDKHKAKANKSQSEQIKKSCDTPLYVVPPSDQIFVSPITVEHHLLAVCADASKYNISTQQFQDLMLLLNLHLPENNLCDLDVQKIKQMSGYNSDIKTIHEYCSKCGALKVDKDAEMCQPAKCGNLFDDNKNTASCFYFWKHGITIEKYS